MLCTFEDFQAESSPVLSEADVRKRFNLARTGAIKACICCAIMSRVRGTAKVLIFTSIKMHMYGKQSTRSHKETLPVVNLGLLMYQSIPSLTIPRAIFLWANSPPPRQKRSSNPAPLGPIKTTYNPTAGALFSIIHYKNMKKLDRNHVKLQRFYHLQMIKR